MGEKIKEIALMYYSRKDVQEAIFNFCKSREVVPRYIDQFGKRPDNLEYVNDLFQHAKKGASSFHCSEELWHNPLDLSTSLSQEQLNEIRAGWDLLIDIDSKYIDYSKITAELLIEALTFHGIKNLSIKYSGSKGFHIIIPWKAFPKEINGEKSSNMFPEWPRIVSMYLTELINPKLIDKITEMTTKDRKSYVKDFEEPKKVAPDLVLVSPRHLFRCPYSLHEKTALASVVIDKNKISSFQPKDADPFKAKIVNFYPEAEEEEARELLVQALDWYQEKRKEEKPSSNYNSGKEYQKIEVDKSSIIYPPSIKKILEGMQDGKKRALFILINFFRSLGFNEEEISKKLEEWNKKNTPQLKEGYIKSQMQWTFRQKSVLPPNYDKDYYAGIGIIPSEEELKLKNPVSYVVRKSKKWSKTGK